MPKYINSKEEAFVNIGPEPKKPVVDLLGDSNSGISGLESTLRGGAQGLSMGYADEITGAIESALTNKSYEQARDESRRNYKLAQEANSGLYTAGEIGGAILPALGSYVASAGTAGAAAPTAAATSANLARLIATGAGLGGIDALGHSEADNFGDMALDTAKGAVLGGAMTTAFNPTATKNAIRGLLGKETQAAIPTVTNKIANKIDDIIPENPKIPNVEAPPVVPNVVENIVESKPVVPNLDGNLDEIFQSAANQNRGVGIEAGDDLVATLTGSNTKLINTARNNPELRARLAGIKDPQEAANNITKKIAEITESNPFEKRARKLASQARDMIDNTAPVNTLNAINAIEKQISNLTSSLGYTGNTQKKKAVATLKGFLKNLYKEVDEKIIDVDGKEKIVKNLVPNDEISPLRLKSLVQDLDDEIIQAKGFFDQAKRNDYTRRGLKSIRADINDILKEAVPEQNRAAYEKLMAESSKNFSVSDNLLELASSSRASKEAGKMSAADLSKIEKFINQSTGKEKLSAGMRAKYLSEKLKDDYQGDLLSDLSDLRLSKYLNSQGNQGSNLVNAWISQSENLTPNTILDSIPLIGKTASKVITNRTIKPSAGYIGKQMETKGKEVALEWADFSRDLMSKGKTPTQDDAYKFILNKGLNFLDPATQNSMPTKILKKISDIPEPAKLNLPSAMERSTTKMSLPDPVNNSAPSIKTILPKVSGTPFEKILNSANARGVASFSATHYLLGVTNPEYRQLTQSGSE